MTTYYRPEVRRPDVRDLVYDRIDLERIRQAALHPGETCADRAPETFKLTILLEEVGEVARAILENTRDQQIKELTEVAAVAVAWLEAMLVEDMG
jgi:NTP pyrophosphatase (non-canonical NTP hydrolase)